MKVSWDDAKNTANQKKHGIAFDEAPSVFASGDYLEIFDEGPSQTEERFIALHYETRGKILVLIRGQFESGKDIAALRRFVGLTQTRLAQAIGISVHTLRNWEQGRRTPEGPRQSRSYALQLGIRKSFAKTFNRLPDSHAVDLCPRCSS